MSSRAAGRVRELTRVPEQGVYWTPPPRPPARRPRVLGREPACPREALAAQVEARGESYAGLSRMVGKRDGYLRCFVKEGHPRALSPEIHSMLADFFGVPERALGVRDLWSIVEEAA